MIVISTGLHTPELARARCLRSVKEQIGVQVEHEAFDAELPTPWAHFQILTECLKSEAPDTIVVSLDLDDWLARPDALAIVQKHHDDGAWVTYGSYKHADGRPGHCEQLKGDPRKVPWVTSAPQDVPRGALPADQADRPEARWRRGCRTRAISP